MIVDEMSMVDVALFSALLRALRPGTPAGAGGGRGPAALGGGGERVLRPDPQRPGGDGVPAGGVPPGGAVRHHPQRPRGEPGPAAPAGQQTRGTSSSSAAGTAGADARPRWWSCARPGCQDHMGIPADQIQVLSPTRKGPSGTAEPEPLSPGGAESAGAGQAGDPVGGAGVPHRGPDHADPERLRRGVGAGRRHRGHRHVQRRRGEDRGDRSLRGAADGELRRPDRHLYRWRCWGRWTWPTP